VICTALWGTPWGKYFGRSTRGGFPGAGNLRSFAPIAIGAGGYSFFLAFGFLACRAGRSPLHCARNSASGRIASRISTLEQFPLQHLYCPVFGATLKLRPSHTGQVYLFLPLPGSSLSRWSRMSKELVVVCCEATRKIASVLVECPLFELLFIVSFGGLATISINRCAQVPIESSGFWRIQLFL
jgi:hypothetical protein